MSDEEKVEETTEPTEAPEAPKQEPEAATPPVDPTLTPEQILVQYQDLAKQARMAGQSLFRMTAQFYMSRALTAIDAAFAGLEGWVSPSSKEEKDKAEKEG